MKGQLATVNTPAFWKLHYLLLEKKAKDNQKPSEIKSINAVLMLFQK